MKTSAPFLRSEQSRSVIVIIIILIALCQLRHLSRRNSKTMEEAVHGNKHIMAKMNYCYLINVIKSDSHCVTWRILSLCSNNLSRVSARGKNALKLTRFHQLTAIIWKCLQKLIKFLAPSQKTNRAEEEQDISPVFFWNPTLTKV